MSNLNTLIARMIEYEDGCVERVNHFLKVFAFAKTIAEGEGLDRETQDVLEAAAVTHDVGIRVCFEKYGSCDGQKQELEGPTIAEKLLPACGYAPAVCARVCYLIGHHHTYVGIDGADYQILVEADFLVNIFENGMAQEAARKIRDNIFKTKTGRKLLTDLYL